ncbi:protein CrdC [Myxococcaceae bacterium GXIMD 01537]
MISNRVAGTLLCHAGPHRVAFAADEVAVIEAAGEWAGRFHSARLAFGEEAGASRVLVAASGEGVGVDALEIDAESLFVLPAPHLLGCVAGGSLRGFILARGEFWPLVRLDGFGRYLEGLSPRGAA